MIFKIKQQKKIILLFLLGFLLVTITAVITTKVIEEKSLLSSEDFLGTYRISDDNANTNDDIYIFIEIGEEKAVGSFGIYDTNGKTIEKGKCKNTFPNLLCLENGSKYCGEIVYSYGEYCFSNNGKCERLVQISKVPILP